MPPPHASSSAAPSGHGPDKRTMAYESIFGRPSAKPKGPMPPPGAPGYGGMHGAPGLPPQAIATSHWVHSQAGAGMPPHAAPSPMPPQWYGAGGAGAPMMPPQQPGMRYPGPPQHMPPVGMNMGMGMGMGPGSSMHPAGAPMYDDRRISMAPSAASDPRMSFYGSAAEAYGSAAPSPAPSAQGASHGGHNGAAPAHMASPAMSVASAAPPSASAPGNSYPEVPGYRHASNGSYSIAAPGSAAGYGAPGLQPTPPPRDDDVSPRAPPRLPSIELGPRKNGNGAEELEDESLWFMPQAKRESVDARAKAAAAAAAVGAALREDDEPGQRTPTSPLKDMRGLEQALPAPVQSEAVQEHVEEERNGESHRSSLQFAAAETLARRLPGLPAPAQHGPSVCCLVGVRRWPPERLVRVRCAVGEQLALHAAGPAQRLVSLLHRRPGRTLGAARLLRRQRCGGIPSAQLLRSAAGPVAHAHRQLGDTGSAGRAERRLRRCDGSHRAL
jgi:hypothetical protein